MDIFEERILPLFRKSRKNDQELEREIDLPRGIIYDWKKRRTKSYKKYCGQIASYFHVSTDYLLGNTDDPTPAGQKETPPAQGGGPIGPNKRALLDLVDTMSDEEMGALLDVVRATLKMRDNK